MSHLYDELQKYGESDYYPYHMPGHKRRLYGNLPKKIAKIDITEIDGFDNLHQAEEILLELQQKAALLYGADESFYLVNGSTGGILSAISAAVPYGGHLLIARNSHKSAYHAAYLRNLRLSYLYPNWIEGYDVCEAITPEQVREALEREADIDAVYIVSPTYEGRIADVQAIAQVVHAKGIPLIVDEAHGAHLGLAKGFAKNSSRLGADLVINSVHKTLPALTQSAILHVNGEIINRQQLRKFLHIYQTSSPSYILMASIDNAFSIVEKKGVDLFSNFYRKYCGMMDCLIKCKRLQIMSNIEEIKSGVQDVGKLVISTKNTHLSGQELYDILLERYHLQLEMAAGTYCLAMFTIGDDDEGYDRMIKALLEIDKEIAEKQEDGVVANRATDCDALTEKQTIGADQCHSSFLWGNVEVQRPICQIPLAKAWDMDSMKVSLQESIGHAIAEFINLYPPGVPILVPGEVMTKGIADLLEKYLQQGLTVQGVDTAQTNCEFSIEDNKHVIEQSEECMHYIKIVHHTER